MNYYLTGIEGMPKMLECCEDPLPSFNRKSYPDAFHNLYQMNFQTLDAIENGYNSVIDKDQFLKNMAAALVDSAREKVESCKRRSAKERKMMDLNMAMAVFVFPMILEYHGNSSRELADRLLEAWKEAFPKTSLQTAEYAEIEQGFHKKFCYITTAVCESFGKTDDCYELNVLRNYRDTYLAALPDGEAMIEEYYDVAPSVVKHINQRENAGEIYRSIWDSYLFPCITMIEEGRNEECRSLYEEMVHTLRDRYMLQKGDADEISAASDN